MRRRILSNANIIGFGNVGDILLDHNITHQKIYVSVNELVGGGGNLISQYMPIGVVVIPKSHNVYGTGEVGIISLLYASPKTPDIGTISNSNDETLYCGYCEKLTNSKVYNGVGCGSYSDMENNRITNYKYINIGIALGGDIVNPRSQFICPLNDEAYYPSQTGGYVPYPFLKDGSRNYMYSQSLSDSNPSAFSDFNGKENTEEMLLLATAQSDWKVATSIVNSSEDGYCPAACACWRFHTQGTEQGDWYIPSAGELGYIGGKLNVINNSIQIIQEIYNNKIAVNIKISMDGQESSTRYAYGTGRCWVSFYNGSVSGNADALMSRSVRPMMRI